MGKTQRSIPKYKERFPVRRWEMPHKSPLDYNRKALKQEMKELVNEFIEDQGDEDEDQNDEEWYNFSMRKGNNGSLQYS